MPLSWLRKEERVVSGGKAEAQRLHDTDQSSSIGTSGWSGCRVSMAGAAAAFDRTVNDDTSVGASSQPLPLLRDPNSLVSTAQKDGYHEFKRRRCGEPRNEQLEDEGAKSPTAGTRTRTYFME
jgi:hypothetical protein